MTTSISSSPVRREPELLGQTVVVIGGSGTGGRCVAPGLALTGATFDIDGGQQLVAS
jgi:5,10-methylene-tetrahydrofolate dehydrogenase/methenyl tetrahydrofolate cyclohydrolase